MAAIIFMVTRRHMDADYVRHAAMPAAFAAMPSAPCWQRDTPLFYDAAAVILFIATSAFFAALRDARFSARAISIITVS